MNFQQTVEECQRDIWLINSGYIHLSLQSLEAELLRREQKELYEDCHKIREVIIDKLKLTELL